MGSSLEPRWKETRQRKFRAKLSPAALLACGGYRSSPADVVQEFLDGVEGEWCIRQEGDDDVFLFSRTGTREPFSNGSRVEMVSYGMISGAQASELKRQYGIRTRVFKTRTVYYFEDHGVQVNVDSVAFLGDFIEIRGEEEGILAVQALLGLDDADLVDESYYELMCARRAGAFEQSVVGLYYRTQDMTFGIVSGVMTAVAVTMGIVGEKVGAILVIQALLSLALGDSQSDAMGVFRLEWLRWGGDLRSAIKVARSTLVGKIGMPLIFALWFFLTRYDCAIWGTVVTAGLVLGVHAYGEAIARQRSRLWHPILMVSLAAFSVYFTRVVTLAITSACSASMPT